MKGPLRILLLLQEAPVPFGNAGSRWRHVLLRELINDGHDVTCIIASTRPQECLELPKWFSFPTDKLKYFIADKDKSIVSKAQLITKPYYYCFSAALRSHLSTLALESYDVVHCEEGWTGWLIEKPTHNALLNIHYLVERDEPDLWAGSGRETLLRYCRTRSQIRLVRRFKHLRSVSDELTSDLRRLHRGSTAKTGFITLDPNFYSFIQADQRPAGVRIGLLGSMNWAPTYRAAVRVITRLWPSIRMALPAAELVVGGWSATRCLEQFRCVPGLQIVDSVPDANEWLKDISILLYPPDCGSGVKVKVQEAMARGVPVITTTAGTEGLPAEARKILLVEDEDDRLIEQTIHLSRNRSAQELYRIAQREQFSKSMSIRASMESLYSQYRDILASSNNPGSPNVYDS